ncbi:hypothetical protein NPIL_302961 [Nephila pilipes]|uniref:Uncharacterized protein n=1 Tax=Nephila pilipes TaxID=299642 RepID=A0A8X6MSU3_NEPPI|nr:hypothetical protein NPIL_302961 [Nephila pilipes]
MKKNGHQRMSKADKEWIKYVLRKQQNNMQLDLRMHVCEYGNHVLQHQMCSVLNKENTIGYKWLKDVNKEKEYQPYNRLAFWYNTGGDYSLSRHVLIGTMTVVILIARL